VLSNGSDLTGAYMSEIENDRHGLPVSGGSETERWSAVMARSVAADGCFVYAVTTTGVYCRPSCPSRRPLRENVVFLESSKAATTAGFRPCRRCRPDELNGLGTRSDAVALACRMMEASETPPALAELAAAVGISPHHFHRVFKAATGLTPKAYADAVRLRRVREGLPGASSVTEAAYASGYNSSGRFYAAAAGSLGMPPAAYRAGGADAELMFAVGQCSLGAILVAATTKGVAAVLLGDSPDALVHDLERRFPRARLGGGDAAFEALAALAIAVVDGRVPSDSLPLDIRGTAFQHRVWQALRAIPAGETASYAELAQRISRPGAARAVARACAGNPLAVAVPCHRVVRNDGGLGGYRWGIERKRALIEREQRDAEPRTRPGSSDQPTADQPVAGASRISPAASRRIR